jgi:hypothetical protein
MNAQTKIQPPDTAGVYAKIAAVQGELAHTGIGKDSENTFDRYKFRGIDAVYNALAPLLAKHGLCVLPRIIERDLQERESRKGDPMFYVTVTAEFDFVSADDGSSHTVRTYGEAMDRSDKATNKAMSAAYKYAAFMAFAIPTEGDNDADASTPEVGKRIEPEPTAKRENWGGRYPNKSKLWAACRTHQAELTRLGTEATFDDLEAFTTSPEYSDFIKQAGEHFAWMLDGPAPDAMPEFVPTFTIEKRARDMIALRGNVPAEMA